MAINAAGLDVAGANNPRWKGGLIAKICEICGTGYSVKPVHGKSRFCSMACVGKSQRGKPKVSPDALKITQKECEICGDLADSLSELGFCYTLGGESLQQQIAEYRETEDAEREWQKTHNAKSQATDAALSRQVACTDGLGLVPGKD